MAEITTTSPKMAQPDSLLFRSHFVQKRRKNRKVEELPLITYDWSTRPVGVDGVRYFADKGSTESYNAELFSGRGGAISGTMSITIPVNATIQTECYMLDGVLTFTEGTQVLTDYVVNTLGTWQNLILYDGIFTQAQKDTLKQNPETFLRIESGVVVSDVIDVSKVIKWIPFTDNDSNVTDLLSTTRYAVTNYTASFNATGLPKGLQTAKLALDTLGRITGVSPYSEWHGDGYADTGYVMPTNEDWTITLIQEFKNNAKAGFNGSRSATADRILLGERSTNTASFFINTQSVSSIALGVGNNMLVATKTGTTFELFVNNVSQGTIIETLINTKTFTIGDVLTGTAFEVEGRISEFSIDNRALTTEERTANYNKAVNQGLLT